MKLQGKTILEPVGTVYPDLLEDKDDIKPSEVSCSDIVASDPQRLLCNQMAALAVSVYLNELFECGTISNHMTMFHAQKGYMRTQPAELDEE